MKLLFAMYHPGFLRLFEPVVRLSLERGHRVQLLFDRKARLGEERLIDHMLERYEGFSVGYLGKSKGDRWVALAGRFRCGADYLRYLDPRYAAAVMLRGRARDKAPRWVRWLGEGLLARHAWLRRLAMGLARAIEQALPVRPSVLAELGKARPDMVIVTPLVVLGSDQVDYVKACRQLGLRCALGVASWDNLTNKGVVRVHPERVFVWNHQQKQEAVGLHDFAPEAVEVCGAWSYDHWFDWQASCSRADFARQVGLAAEGCYLLYVCSSKFIAPYEVGFVRAWIQALRRSGEPALESIGVLIRPHPQNAEQWNDVDLRDLGDVTIWPRGGANPIDVDTRSGYFNSIAYSEGIVGINTSAQIESGIIGRPVFTIMTPEFAGTQEGTLHFHYLNDADNGLLFAARSFDEHCVQLAAVLGSDDRAARSRKFVEDFIRPHGYDRPGGAHMVQRLEEIVGQPAPAPMAPRLLDRLLRLALGLLRSGAKAPAVAKPRGTARKA